MCLSWLRLSLLGLPDTEANSEHLTAADVLLERGVFIGITEDGYFIGETEEDRERCVSYGKRELERSLAELKRVESWRVGEGKPFPPDGDS
jgi:hypothetical protein